MSMCSNQFGPNWARYPFRKLTCRDIDDLIRELRAADVRRFDGEPRKKWSLRSCNYMIKTLRQERSHGFAMVSDMPATCGYTAG